jgi:hypothetical protein
MGVTGTLGCLHEEEKKVAKEEYKVSLKVQGHHRTIDVRSLKSGIQRRP